MCANVYLSHMVGSNHKMAPDDPSEDSHKHLDLVTRSVSAISNVVIALLALFGLPIALRQLWMSRKSQKEYQKRNRQQSVKELLNTYLKEYREPQMGRAISRLWDLYRIAGGNPTKIVELYTQLYERSRNRYFHFNIRRRVSAFYQQLALLIENDECAREEVYRIWSRGSFELIPKVLRPIEAVAIPRILKRDHSEIYDIEALILVNEGHSLKMMMVLYENAPSIR